MPAGIIAAGVVGAADGADHLLAGSLAPEGTHALAGMASPALDEGTGGEVSAVDLTQFGLVKPGFGTTVDLIAIIEHETGTVGVTKVFKISNLDAVTRLPRIQVIQELLFGVKENKVELEFLLHTLDFLKQVLFFLTLATADIAGPVNKPGDEGVVAVGLPQFFKSYSGGMDEVCPPMIVGDPLELLPLDQGRTPGDDDVFGCVGLLGAKGDTARKKQEQQREYGSFHDQGVKVAGENLLQSNHALNLDIEGAGKLGTDRSAGRRMVATEIFGINRIHFLKILRTQITEIDSAGDRICQVCSRSFCDSADILKNETGLLGNAAALDLPGCRIPGRHSGNEEEWTSGGNGQRVRAERRRTISYSAMGGLHKRENLLKVES